MLEYPNIDPVIFSFTDAIAIRWYGVTYVLGFIVAWFLLRHRTKHLPGWESTDTLADFFFYAAMGVILGGRLGYMLFYNIGMLFEDPVSFFKVWEGGMSFHGGLIGVMLGIWYFARKHQLSFLQIGDRIAPGVPLALGFGRIGNFINAELWGKVTDVPWGMVFPGAGPLPRHPSQLYAVALEGVLLFIIVWCYSAKPRALGNVSGVFLIGYGLIRSFEELFRVPDPQFGYLAFGWLTMGQVLCVPMILLGVYFIRKEFEPRGTHETVS